MTLSLSNDRQAILPTVVDACLGKEDKLSLSFEFFPPNTPKMQEILWQSIQHLSLLEPNFVSVTYGAGGSGTGGTSQDRTLATVMRIKRDTQLNVAAHLTSLSTTRDQIDTMAYTYWNAGIRHIVALRGDRVQQAQTLNGIHDGFDHYPYALDLVRRLRQIADFEISVAAYPECHPEASSLQDDLDNLKRKVDAGATRAITQFFFDNHTFMDFYNRTIVARVNVPIIAGILPIANLTKTVDLARRCGTVIPRQLMEILKNLDGDPETQKIMAINFATHQCLDLYRQGIRHFHFYTLNRSSMITSICRMLEVHDDLPWLIDKRR